MTDMPTFDVSEAPEGADIPPQSYTENNGFECEVCRTPLVYSGRGRHPRFCDVHKPGKTSNSAGSSGDLNAARQALIQLYTGMGMVLNFVDPFDGMTVANSAESLADSWITLAKSNKNVRKMLLKMTQGGGWATVIIAHGMVAWPIVQHHEIKLPRLFARNNKGYGDTGP